MTDKIVVDPRLVKKIQSEEPLLRTFLQDRKASQAAC